MGTHIQRRTFLGAMSALGLAAVLPTMSSSAAPPAGSTGVRLGDLLVTNHDFATGLEAWRPAGRDKPVGAANSVPRQARIDLVSGQEWHAGQAAQLTRTAECPVPGIASDSVPVVAGTEYTAWVDLAALQGATWVSLSFRGADGTVVTEVTTTVESALSTEVRTVRVQGTAPAGATVATVTVHTNQRTIVDRVLVSAQVTDLGNQITSSSRNQASRFGHTSDGTPVIWGAMTGAHGIDARLFAAAIETGEVLVELRIPACMGSWDIAVTTSGTVYVAGYNYGDAKVGGHLYRHVPGTDTVEDLGAPVPGDTFLFAVTLGDGDDLYGGSFPSARVWRYNPATGFSTIGPKPIIAKAQYVRSVAFEPVTGYVFAGTGTTGTHLMACPTRTAGPVVDVLPEAYRSLPWVYDVEAGDGHVFIRATDDHGDDHLVVLRVETAADGSLVSTVVKELPGLAFPGTSLPYEGKVYYLRNERVMELDYRTGVERDLGIGRYWSRFWQIVPLGPDRRPTLLGTWSGGTIFTYDLATGAQRTVTVTLPGVPSDLQTLVKGPDGAIYSSGYLVGGLGRYRPMRSDQGAQWSGSQNFGQAEGMTVLGNRVYQGVYPRGYVNSFDVTAMVPATRATTHCELGQGQDRPYGMTTDGSQVYLGTMAVYGQNSGAISVFDPATGNWEVHLDAVPNQTIARLLFHDGVVYGGSMIYGGLGVEPVATEGVFLLFDPQTRTTRTVDLPVRGLRAVTGIALGRDGLIWVAAETWLFAFDPATSSWVRQADFAPESHFPVTFRLGAYTTSLVSTPSGELYGTFAQKFLFRVDQATGAADRVFTGAVQQPVVDDLGNVYAVYGANRMLRFVSPAG